MLYILQAHVCNTESWQLVYTSVNILSLMIVMSCVTQVDDSESAASVDDDGERHYAYDCDARAVERMPMGGRTNRSGECKYESVLATIAEE